MPTICGVDPGLQGALALLDPDLDLLVVKDMPVVQIGRKTQVSETLVAQLLREWAPDVVFMEEVHAMPKQGVTSTFNFGLGFGMLRGVCAGLALPYTLVPPHLWKPRFRLSRDKREARAMALRIYPRNAADFTRVKDHGRAEACLLATYGALYAQTF